MGSGEEESLLFTQDTSILFEKVSSGCIHELCRKLEKAYLLVKHVGSRKQNGLSPLI